jgi:hypothetical protein
MRGDEFVGICRARMLEGGGLVDMARQSNAKA